MNLRALAFLTACTCLAAAPAPATNAQAEAIVKKGIAYAQKNTAEKLFQQINQADGIFHVGQGSELFLFVYDTTGTMKAIGFKSAEMAGKNRLEVKDPDGKYFVKEIIKVGTTKGKGWVDYKFTNPVTGKTEGKTTYVEMYDNLIYCCGIYKK